MATDGETSPEDDMLPDEREAIAERGSHIEDLDDEEYLSPDELAEKLGFESE